MDSNSTVRRECRRASLLHSPLSASGLTAKVFLHSQRVVELLLGDLACSDKNLADEASFLTLSLLGLADSRRLGRLNSKTRIDIGSVAEAVGHKNVSDERLGSQYSRNIRAIDVDQG